LDLVKEYETVLREYEIILNLSRQILVEIKEGMIEETLVPLLEEKQKVADNIKELTENIAQTDASEGSPRNTERKENAGLSPRFDFTRRPQQVSGHNLSQIKSLLKQIRSKAESLLKTEEEIKKALEEKG
jgi:cell division septum initiation protein DivIVA